MGAVAQQYGEQICRGGRGVDGPSKALCCQARQQAAVIDVRMGQNDEIQTCGIKGKGLLVVLVGLAAALGHAAVDEEAAAMGLDQKAGAGDRLGRAVESDVHGNLDFKWQEKPGLAQTRMRKKRLHSATRLAGPNSRKP